MWTLGNRFGQFLGSVGKMTSAFRRSLEAVPALSAASAVNIIGNINTIEAIIVEDILRPLNLRVSLPALVLVGCVILARILMRNSYKFGVVVG
jgi:hypothetical protein